MDPLFEWPEFLNKETKKEIFSLMNCIIEKENTLGFLSPLRGKDGRKILAGLQQDILEKKKHLLLIRNEKFHLIGHLILTPNSLPNCAHRGEISRVMVHPKSRCFSLILAGLREVIRKCDTLKVCSIELDVRANTLISKLWERLGFEIIGIHPDYVRINGYTERGIYMRQSILELKKKYCTPCQ